MSQGKWSAELLRFKMVNHALAYARRGWPVIPIWWPSYAGVCACPESSDCPNVAKHPLVSGGQLSATTDMDQIRSWWAKWPDANIAIATGEACGFTVLDVDPDHGGQKTFSMLMAKFGRPDPTNVSVTGSGGRHILWRWREEHRCGQNIRPGIDVRAEGGYIIAPPSLHGSGYRYQWHKDGHPKDIGIGVAPGWVESILRGNRVRGERSSGIKGGPVAEGGRNVTLFKYACRFQRMALSDEDLSNKVHALNVKLCKPPLGDREVDKIIKSALRYKKGE